MTTADSKKPASQPATSNRQPATLSNILTILKWNLIATGMVVLMYMPFTAMGSMADWGWRILVIFVYSNFIGTLVAMALDFGPLSRRVNRLPAPAKWIVFVLTLVVATAVGCVAASGLLASFDVLPMQSMWLAVRYSLAVGIGVSLILGISGAVFDTLQARLDRATLALRTKELEEERARKLAAEARLSSLESRVHPHFLFNTLNSIAALIREDPERAERTVEHLAALLRFSLDSSNTRTVSLRQELTIVEKYLDIERMRFGPRLQYEIDVPESLKTVDVPPLSIQTLVENSVKYAVSSSRQGAAIRISARSTDDTVTIEVSDTGPGFTQTALLDGHGLDNLRERLSAVYGVQGILTFGPLNGRTCVAVSVPRNFVPVELTS